MALLPNETCEHILLTEDKKATYADLLSLVLNAPVEGQKANELRLTLKVLDACENAKDTIEVPDEALPFVKRAVSNFPWRLPSKEAKQEVVAFCDAVDSL